MSTKQEDLRGTKRYRMASVALLLMSIWFCVIANLATPDLYLGFLFPSFFVVLIIFFVILALNLGLIIIVEIVLYFTNLNNQTKTNLVKVPGLCLVLFFTIAGFYCLIFDRQAGSSSDYLKNIESVKDLKSTGFTFYGARRWLYSFKIRNEKFFDLVQSRRLVSREDLDVCYILKNDSFFKKIDWSETECDREWDFFYSNRNSSESGQRAWGEYLFYDTNSERALLLQFFQQ